MSFVIEGGFSLVGKDHTGFWDRFGPVLAVLGHCVPVLASFALFSGPGANGAVVTSK